MNRAIYIIQSTLNACAQNNQQCCTLNRHCAQRKMNINVHAQNTKNNNERTLLYALCGGGVPSYAMYAQVYIIYIHYTSLYTRGFHLRAVFVLPQQYPQHS